MAAAGRQIEGTGMSHRDPTYVVFDGDNDKWAYAYMKGWKINDRIDFDFRDAHDLDTMTGRAQDRVLRENEVKGAHEAITCGYGACWRENEKLVQVCQVGVGTGGRP